MNYDPSRATGNRAPRKGPARTRFVLVEPQGGGNVGATARALKNLGYSRLDVVRPGCQLNGREARMMAVAARDVLAAATVHDDLDAALDGAAMVVGVTGRTGKQRRPHWRLDSLCEEMSRTAGVADVALVFGREDRGLTDRELDSCTHLVYLPSSKEYPSFNLAQAVLLVAWELHRSDEGSPADSIDPPADHASREALYDHLEQAFRAIGYLNADGAESILRQFRRLLGRARMTDQEVRLLRGLARQVLWTARRAGLPD